MQPIRAFCAVLAGAAVIAACAPAMAQQWPERQITVVSPFVSGTTNDLIAELVLNQVGRQFARPFVIENRPGGSGSVGVAAVIHAAPDGYTYLAHRP